MTHRNDNSPHKLNPFQKLVHWYASLDAMPYWGVLAMDSLLVLVSGILSCIFIVGGYNTMTTFEPLMCTLIFGLVGYLLGFRIFHTYSGILRLSSFIDLQRVVLATIVGIIFSLIESLFSNSSVWIVSIPPLALIIQGIFSMIMMMMVRIWGKMVYEGYQRRRRYRRVFIYGTADGGVALAKNINTNANSPYMLEGFITDNPNMVDKYLMGVRVYMNDAKLMGIINKKRISDIIVSPKKSESLSEHNDFVNAMTDAGIKVLVIPGAMEWNGKSELKTSMLREVNIEDLLPRQKIEVDLKCIGEQLADKRILITGAAGSIGSEMVRQVAEFCPSEMILIDQAETPLHDIRLMMARQWPDIKTHTIVADIANYDRIADIFHTYHPQYVFHAAAYKHVPMMEDNPAESISNNVKGTKIVADLSVEEGVEKFVMVSTDKAVNPTNVMGCSKRICEIYVQALDKAEKEGKVKGNTQFVTTRFGNVLGSNGSVIPLFKKQIKEGGPVTVTHPDIIRFFMLIPEACKLVLEAGTMGNGGEIFVFDMGEPVKIVDLAQRMIRLSGATDIEVKFTGLRDGEKLYEEVLSEMEQTKPTFHPKIMIATVREYDFDRVCAVIDEMIEASYREGAMQIVARMKSLVPEFKSQHSIYEQLDKR
ncbi:MAG: polysaccharide biosynthesis protein [Clostridium sp.]|nr:polysaccharide biosynthesis protein [Prevotella sp.]MCM1428490.1 polysaccharide biosynthesis protein [Clostridium sp.]